MPLTPAGLIKATDFENASAHGDGEAHLHIVLVSYSWNTVVSEPRRWERNLKSRLGVLL